MTNEELIEKLHRCIPDFDGCSEECELFNDSFCQRALITAATNALESAEKRIARLEEDLKTREAEREVMQNTIKVCEKRIKELSLDNRMLKNTIDAEKGVMLDRIRFLEAQLQKEGEWALGIDADGDPVIYCTNCIIPTNVKTNDCPNCGASMKGENYGENYGEN